jgi:hypothetical protein
VPVPFHANCPASRPGALATKDSMMRLFLVSDHSG